MSLNFSAQDSNADSVVVDTVRAVHLQHMSDVADYQLGTLRMKSHLYVDLLRQLHIPSW